MVDRMSELFGYLNDDKLVPKRSSVKSVTVSKMYKAPIIYSDNINILTKELLDATLANQKI